MGFKEEIEKAQKQLAGHDKKMARLISRYGPPGFKPHGDHYAELVTSIVGQQISIAAAAAIWKRVLDLFDGTLPTPKQLIAVDSELLRAAGVSYPKISYMKDLAQHIIDGRLDMDHVAALPNDELIQQLTAVKGIGEWSAHMFMIFSLARLDVLPVGDLGIRKAAMNVYSLPALPVRDELIELAEENKWAPYQSVAAWYLWKSLENEGIRIKKDKIT